MKEKPKMPYVLWFNQIDKNDIPAAGGKGANLGEMVTMGLPVPDGFVVTATAYDYFVRKNKLRNQIANILKITDTNDPRQLKTASDKIKKFFLSGNFPKKLANEIFTAYDQLSGSGLHHCLVAVRSSATAEDLPGASFAGQQETFLNVKGEAVLVDKIRHCWASLFTPRAIFYREQKNFEHFKVKIACPIQKMIQSEASGVMFTADPMGKQKNLLVIEAIWGLGEMIVQGQLIPDRYLLERTTLKILEKQTNEQKEKLIRRGGDNQKVKIPKGEQKKQKISDSHILELATLGKKIHQHYFFPQDIEWATEAGKVYILQTRPITTISQKLKVKSQKLKIKLPLIVKGTAASPGMATGPARVIYSAKEIQKIQNGEVLVTPMTTPDFVPAMRKVVAIVTDKGGQTSHAAIVSRELGLPCVVGTQKATQLIKNEMVITVNGKTGEVFKGGTVEDQIIKYQIERKGEREFQPPLKTATKVYVNLGEPELAKEIAQRNVDGVGLLRAEFMIAQIGVHPKRLIERKKEKFFVDKLSEGITTFCQAFSPRPVVYRATDFKTNEYANLTGGKFFEPKEPNPLLGFRGACRFIVQPEVFELEIEAIKKVRNKEGFKNLWLMIPFVHTLQELGEVKKIIASNGLQRSPTFKLWMMVEIPSNVILLDEFIKIGIDGVSIGSNDLTMLVLGIDRDNQEVATAFDEEDPAVLWAIERVIKIANKYRITSSICGQAPSTKPDLIEKLVRWGITSISVNPDMIEQAREIIYEVEKRVVG